MRREMHAWCWERHAERKILLEKFGVVGRMILKCILEKEGTP
jgi:hypothetical protein